MIGEEHDLGDGRQLCTWCLGPTVRTGHDGKPRHGWCDNPQTALWRKTRRPDQGSYSPEYTFLRKYRKRQQKATKPAKAGRGKRKR